MAYNHPQGSDKSSWPVEDPRNQSSTSCSRPIVDSSQAEQPQGTSPISFGDEANTQRWDFQPLAYGSAYGTYYPHSDDQQPVPGQRMLGSSTLRGGNDPATGSQRSPMTHYTPLQSYMSQPHYVPAYPATDHSMRQGYSVVTATEFNPLASVAPVHSPMSLYNSMADAGVSFPGTAQNTPLAAAPKGALADAEYSVPCPYRCGTVLTGVHALGNLTRHLKIQACAGSSRAKVRYLCPIEGCEKQYARSDGLRVHMRRRHGAPPAVPRTDGIVDEDEEQED